MKLTAENVRAVFKDCLYTDEEYTAIGSEAVYEQSVKVRGVVVKAGFNPVKIKKHKSEIRELLKQLPNEFSEENGGASFLNACVDSEGNQWGEHRSLDELMCLGEAAKLVSVVPQIMWPMLPGGVPYFTVLNK